MTDHFSNQYINNIHTIFRSPPPGAGRAAARRAASRPAPGKAGDPLRPMGDRDEAQEMGQPGGVKIEARAERQLLT